MKDQNVMFAMLNVFSTLPEIMKLMLSIMRIRILQLIFFCFLKSNKRKKKSTHLGVFEENEDIHDNIKMDLIKPSISLSKTI